MALQRRTLLSVGARACVLGSALAVPALLRAQAPLRIIVPYGAGGAVDATVRILAEAVAAQLGTVVVENKPGAGGNIGVAAVAHAAPDGRTLGIAATSTHAVNPWLFAKLPFDAEQDFAAITQMVRVPNVLVVNADFARQRGVATLADLLRYAKSHPGQLNYGSGGNGSAGHLAGEMFKQQAGVYAVHIPFNGGNPAQLALLSGQVDFNFDNLATAAANIRAGKLKALAVTSAQPSPMLPGVPTVASLLPGFAIDTWWGLVAPAATPAAVREQLSRVFREALAQSATRQRYAALLAEPVGNSPAQFQALMQAERSKYQAMVRASGAKVD
jgi:tripartite-type tricarboxylate transporter receptor subunit TctC